MTLPRRKLKSAERRQTRFKRDFDRSAAGSCADATRSKTHTRTPRQRVGAVEALEKLLSSAKAQRQQAKPLAAAPMPPEGKNHTPTPCQRVRAVEALEKLLSSAKAQC